MIFQDRQEAGKKLGHELEKRGLRPEIVFALPRGGVVVGSEIARILGVDFDIIVVRKLGVPHYPELGFGAISLEEVEVIDWEIVRRIGITAEEITEAIRQESIELVRRIKTYRGSKGYKNLINKTIAIVDDGIATGATMTAAVGFARTLNPGRIIVASPVCAQDTIGKILDLGIELVCLESPEVFYAVGEYYRLFSQTSDQEVVKILRKLQS